MAVRSAGWDETQSEKYQCRIDTISSRDDEIYLPETCREFEINILRIRVHLVGFI